MTVVKVNEGLLEGEELINEYGGKYYSFKGVPYARPPLGNLRYQPPQPAEPWTGVRSAKEFGPVSVQKYLLDPEGYPNMSEDCLYLNVYTPDTKPKQLLPVMIWIHGGGFIWGSGNDDMYGPEFLVRQGVVLVTINYRLETVGYLCLDIKEIPGNAGMKDQVAAMRWVKKNIGNFGGNPDNITIFGESAGAGSTSHHLISPMTRGLFRRAIVQSGSVMCFWGVEFASREKGLYIAKQLGCFSEDDQTLVEFFKNAPVEKLVGNEYLISKSQKPYEISYSVANEKDFGQERYFYGDVTEIIRRGAHEDVEIMIGYTKHEGLVSLTKSSMDNLLNEAKYFSEFFVPIWLRKTCLIADQLEIGKKMRQFYVKGEEVTKEHVLNYLNTDMFTYGVYLETNIHSRKNKVFMYKFTCFTERNVFAGVLGLTDLFKGTDLVCHGDDFAYLFTVQSKTEKVDKSSETFKLIDMVTKMWTNFAKFGNPTPDKSLGVEWKPFTEQKQDYLDIGNKLTLSSGPDREEHEFWEKIFKEYLPKYTTL